jgi:hypothetical protein
MYRIVYVGVYLCWETMGAPGGSSPVATAGGSPPAAGGSSPVAKASTGGSSPATMHKNYGFIKKIDDPLVPSRFFSQTVCDGRASSWEHILLSAILCATSSGRAPCKQPVGAM